MAKSWHYIPTDDVEGLNKKVRSLSRKAGKLGVTPVSIQVGTPIDFPVLVTHGERETYLRRCLEVPTLKLSESQNLSVLSFTPVVVTGEPVKLNGWRFITALDHVGDGEPVIRSLSEEPVPAYVATRRGACDHCRTLRRRSSTYLIRHENGSEKIVGKACLADFVGSADAHKVAEAIEAAFSYIAGLGDSEDYLGGDSPISIGDRLETVLVTTRQVIAVDGWISRTKAEETSRLPTSAIVGNALWGRSEADRELRVELAKVAKSDDLEVAKAAIEWASKLSDEEVAKSDYLRNLRTIARNGIVVGRHLGFAVSLLPTFQRTQERVLEQAKVEKKPSNWVGEVGKRSVWTLTVQRLIPISSQWGLSTLILFTDSEGNRLKWFKSGGQGDFAVGKIFAGPARVKAHEVYQNSRETILTRASLVEVK